MKKAYDFAKGKRGAVLNRASKRRVTIYLDEDVIEYFRERADQLGKGYQTLINDALRAQLGRDSNTKNLDAAQLRKILREELARATR